MATPITLSTSVSASPEKVFAALTESAGLASFWTSDSHAEPVVGSIARSGFPQRLTARAAGRRLDPGRRVVWIPLTDPLGGPHWTGTTVTWDLRGRTAAPRKSSSNRATGLTTCRSQRSGE